jgi:hypothetical protein
MELRSPPRATLVPPMAWCLAVPLPLNHEYLKASAGSCAAAVRLVNAVQKRRHVYRFITTGVRYLRKKERRRAALSFLVM